MLASALEFLRRRKVVFMISAMVMTLIVIGGWVVFPWLDSDFTIEHPNGIAVRVENTRRYQLLPAANLGFSRDTLWGCGDTASFQRTRTRIGFLEVTDNRKETRILVAE
jgi:hypothetical protein